MTRTAAVSLAVVAVLVVGALTWLTAPAGFLGKGGTDDTPLPATQTAAADVAARPDSHRLSTAPDGGVTFVEFLDFECEACRAVHPVIERLRAEYGDRVTFVVRYFPIQSHANAERAARAVEAAARQGAFEKMYQRMFETQAEWGEQQTPMDERFRGEAARLGLDLATWDRDYAAPETLARIRADVADGQRLGIRGTPSFFLDGERLEPQTVGDLTAAFDRALAR
jgi:protein-disulfide isomerase